MCELSGRRKIEYDGVGPDGMSVDQDQSWWTLNYVGGVQLASHEGNSIYIGTQTIPGSALKLPMDVVYSAVFDYGFKSCSIQYNGKTVQGVPGNSIPNAGENLWWCTCTFECPGNIPIFDGET